MSENANFIFLKKKGQKVKKSKFEKNLILYNNKKKKKVLKRMVIWFFFQKWYKGCKKPRIKENSQRMDDIKGNGEKFLCNTLYRSHTIYFYGSNERYSSSIR